LRSCASISPSATKGTYPVPDHHLNTLAGSRWHHQFAVPRRARRSGADWRCSFYSHLARSDPPAGSSLCGRCEAWCPTVLKYPSQVVRCHSRSSAARCHPFAKAAEQRFAQLPLAATHRHSRQVVRCRPDWLRSGWIASDVTEAHGTGPHVVGTLSEGMRLRKGSERLMSYLDRHRSRHRLRPQS
jgi:hypothetical protein